MAVLNQMNMGQVADLAQGKQHHQAGSQLDCRLAGRDKAVHGHRDHDGADGGSQHDGNDCRINFLKRCIHAGYSRWLACLNYGRDIHGTLCRGLTVLANLRTDSASRSTTKEFEGILCLPDHLLNIAQTARSSMSFRTLHLDDALGTYILRNALREHPSQAALREEAAALPAARMQISPDQAQFLAFLIQLLGARKAIEIGVLAGYSALALALALPEDGHLLACDVSDRHIQIGQRHWEDAGVASKIDLRIGPALETLDERLRQGTAGKYDFAFIDADKRGYDAYYERCLLLLRAGGVIAIDNVLWGGKVAGRSEDSKTAAIRAFNAKVQGDKRVDISLLAIGDGLTLARKR